LISPVFLDTVGLLALWDRSDQWHSSAAQAFREFSEERVGLYTSSLVLLECANAASRPADGLRAKVRDRGNRLQL
jgi:predicted nucleic acid-binding protein